MIRDVTVMTVNRDHRTLVTLKSYASNIGCYMFGVGLY